MQVDPCPGAVYTTVVSKGANTMKRLIVLALHALLALEPDELAELIRPSVH